uniref:Uncharacterized protein n=1 Tax=Setaria italica TaxID=4555 RepID=K3XSL7_SETIT
MDQIASQIPSWKDETNIGIGSRDEDNDGPEIGAGAWVEGMWQDHLDPHPLPPRESYSTVDFDPDYNPNPSERKGELVPNRDKDVLNLALGTKEHGGCVRGVSSKLTIKDGFERDRASYKSHSHYKDDLREGAEKALESRFKDFLLATLADVGSTIAQPYPIDSICISTPCSLHVPIGRAGKTKEVAKDLAIPIGGLFEGKPILHHYAYVTVLEINSNYGDHEIDIPTAEGIHCLGQSITPPAAASEEQHVATPPASPAAASEPVDLPEDHPPPAQASPQQKQVDLPEEPQQQQMAAKMADKTQDIQQPGYSKPRTDTKYNLVVGVDDIPDLPDCPKKFEYGKPLLPDWAITGIPGEMQRMHNWYTRACRLGLRTIWARYSPDDAKNDMHVVKEKDRYLDPYAICEVRHNFPSQCGDNHDKLAKYKTKKDKRVKRVQQHKKAMRRVSTYIAYMMLKWQDRPYIWVPYNFQGHWIAFMIQLKNGVVTVFDSLDYDQSTYKEFIFILQKLDLPALHYNGGIRNPERPKETVVRTNFPCHKRPSSSVHCRYYMCEPIRLIPTASTTWFVHEQQLLNIGIDLCRFILREVVNPMGTYYHPKHKLAQEDKYVSL